MLSFIKNIITDFSNKFRKKQMSLDEVLEILKQELVPAIKKELSNAPKIVIIGETGVGKSSTLNALFNAGAEISHVAACTQEPNKFTLKTEKGEIVFYDMPGLGESLGKQKEHLDLYKSILGEAEVILLILDAQNRSIYAIQRYLQEEFSYLDHEILSKIVIGLNKVDLIYPNNWNIKFNMPSSEQEKNIAARAVDVDSKIKEALPNWNGNIIPYSANRRYRLYDLLLAMMDAMPNNRAWVLSQRTSIADMLDLVDDSVREFLQQESDKILSDDNNE